MSTINTISQLFEDVGNCLTAETAERLNRFRVNAALQQQLDEWADKSLRGTLNDEERSQYEATLRGLNFLAVLQAKARRIAKVNAQ